MFLLQMQTQSCLPLFLLFIVLITTSFPAVTFCQKNVTLFQNCTSPFRCGKNFLDIRYPYWGGNRSSECGEAGAKVTCVKDDYLTIDISGRIYRVLHINNTSYSITVASNGLWNGGCLENYTDTPIPEQLHPFIPVVGETVDLVLYYDCLNGVQNENPRTRFGCTNSGERNPRVYYFWNDTDCGSSIRVPALKSKVDEFKKDNASVDLWELVESGFNVEYLLNWTACIGCLFSKGVCWHGTNSPEHTCLCSDGSRPSDLPFCRGKHLSVFSAYSFPFSAY